MKEVGKAVDTLIFDFKFLLAFVAAIVSGAVTWGYNKKTVQSLEKDIKKNDERVNQKIADLRSNGKEKFTELSNKVNRLEEEQHKQAITLATVVTQGEYANEKLDFIVSELKELRDGMRGT